jgi:invasion protein IalB
LTNAHPMAMTKIFAAAFRRELAVVVFATVFAGAAMAQPAAAPRPAAPALTRPQPAAGAAQPQVRRNAPTDVQTFGDWTTRCFPVKSVAPCDMLQAVINKQNKKRITSVSVAYIPSRDEYGLQIIVPVGIALAKGLTVTAGSHKIDGLKFRRCEYDGCYVEVALGKDAVEGLAEGGDKGTLTFFPYRADKPVSLPLSLKGYSSALAKMKELARQKAVTPPPAGTTPPASTAPSPAPAQ